MALLRRLSSRLPSAPDAAANLEGPSGWPEASPDPLFKQPKLPWWPRDRACPMMVDSTGTCARPGATVPVNAAAWQPAAAHNAASLAWDAPVRPALGP